MQDVPAPSPGSVADEGSAVPAPSRRGRLLRLAGKASWNVGDQILSALTNAVLFFVVARSVDVAGLDAFSTAFYLFSLLIGIERALVGQVLQIRFSDATPEGFREAVGRALGATLAVTLAASTVMLAVGLAVRGVLGATLIATAVILPATVLQDACRLAFFTHHQAKLAALNDLLWAVIQFTAVWLLLRAGAGSAPSLVLAWGGAAAVCVAVALAQLRTLPRLGGALSWLRETWGMSGFFLGEYLLGAGAFNGGFLLVGVIAGEGAVGSIRGAQVLLGPLGILASGLLTFALPELSRRTWLSSAARMRVSLAITGLMAVVATAYITFLVLLPDSAGSFLFRSNWDGAKAVLLQVAIGSLGAACSLGPATNIYAMGKARKTFRLMVIEAPLVFTLMLSGAALGGVTGATWGLAIDQCALVPLWFLQLRAILKQHDREQAAQAAATS